MEWSFGKVFCWNACRRQEPTGDGGASQRRAVTAVPILALRESEWSDLAENFAIRASGALAWPRSGSVKAPGPARGSPPARLSSRSTTSASICCTRTTAQSGVLATARHGRSLTIGPPNTCLRGDVSADLPSSRPEAIWVWIFLATWEGRRRPGCYPRADPGPGTNPRRSC